MIKEIVSKIAKEDKNWTIRIHAGENDSLKSNMSKAIQLVEESVVAGQTFPYIRIGHGLYCASLTSKLGKDLMEKIKTHDVVLEFQLTSNVRLNNIMDLKKHPLKKYLEHGISCVMGTDGYGLYGTDSIDEQLALSNFLKLTDDEFMQMKAAENRIIERQTQNFKEKSEKFEQSKGNLSVCDYYMQEFAKPCEDIRQVTFEINKQPSYPVFKQQVKELPWDKYPIVIAGGSFASGNASSKISVQDQKLLDALLTGLDPKKVFFVIGHKLCGQEKYIVDHNKGFEIYSIIPSLMTTAQIKKLSKINLSGIRISIEAQEMGIYKSFNYEIFERRNCVLFAFDGNSAVANLVQEARNGKGRAWIFVHPGSVMLREKARSLEGYVTVSAPVEEILQKIYEIEDNIGTRI